MAGHNCRMAGALSAAPASWGELLRAHAAHAARNPMEVTVVSRRFLRMAALGAALVLVAGACASEDEGSSDTTEASGGDSSGSEITACQVTDTGGVDDRSFNQTANDGLVQAEDELGVQGKVLESSSEADFEPNIKAFVDQDCDLIIPVGFLLDWRDPGLRPGEP
ncbi:MAG: BMP family ABC transporter substrate-binding protein [Microthrixaceae bacterium]